VTTLDEVLAWLGTTDVYVLDQVMRLRLRPPMRVLDVGCGGGRNAELLLRAGFDVHGVDVSEKEVERARRRAAEAAPHAPASQFRQGAIETLPYPDAHFDAVVCVAVLHFARDRAHFDAMVAELRRVVRPGGLLFARLATTIGVESLVRPLGGGRWRMGDGDERFLVDEAALVGLTARIGGELADPLKTTIVQGRRAMTTWVVRVAAADTPVSARPTG